MMDALFTVTDVLPTIMSLARLKNDIPTMVQGIDFSKKLLGRDNNIFKEPKGVLIMLNRARGIQSKNYTLCLREKSSSKDKTALELQEVYLYDNINDPYQLKKIPIKELPEVATELLDVLGQELKRTNDPWYKKLKYKYLINYPI